VRAGDVEWFEADVTGFTSPHCFHLWHDRAVFHFLMDKADRQKYVQTLKRKLTLDGHVIIATFAINGPLKCSGLEVARYDASAIAAELGEGFRLLEQVDETHTTPSGTEQKFSYFRFAPQCHHDAMKPIYLDYNASTPIAPEVPEAMRPFLNLQPIGVIHSPY
jgi:hypothetical protein